MTAIRYLQIVLEDMVDSKRTSLHIHHITPQGNVLPHSIHEKHLRHGHVVQIMLKDMADSKRINHNIHRLTPQAMPSPKRQRPQSHLDDFSATVVSSLFWPPHLVRCFLDAWMGLPLPAVCLLDLVPLTSPPLYSKPPVSA